MPKKKAVAKKSKNNKYMDSIVKIHACIEADQKQLDKQYKQAAVNIKKNIASTTQALAKAKKQVAQAKANQKKSPKAYKTAHAQFISLKAELAMLQDTLSSAMAEHKKFVAQQKAMRSFEQQWNKKLAAQKKQAKKSRKISAKKSKATKAPTYQVADREQQAPFYPSFENSEHMIMDDQEIRN